MIYFQGQCKVLTDINFDEMTYVHLLEILKRLVPNGFEKVYYCKSGAKLTSIREIKSDKDIVDMLKVGYDNWFSDRYGKKGNKHRVLPRKVRTRLFRGDEGNQASKKPVKKPIKKVVKKPVKKIRLKMESLKVLIEQSWLRRHNHTKYKEEVRDTQGETKELEVRKGDQSYGVSLQHKFGTNMWKRTNDVPPLPPIIRKMPGRPQKKRIPAPSETSGSQCASRGGGRSGRGDGNDGSGLVVEAVGRVGRGGGRAGGSGKRGGGRAGRGSERGGVFPSSSSCGILTAEQEYQLELDEQAFRESMEEQAREQAKIDAEQEKLDKERREEQEYEEKNDYFNPANWPEESMKEAPMNQQYHEVFIPSIHSQPTQQSGVWVVDTTVSDDGPAVDKGKAKASVEDGPAPQQGISIEDGPAPKKKRGRPPSSVDGIRIHHKNRGRSERIANMKLNKPFQFDKFGTGSTPDKAFDVEE
ncbi:hypothetical protein Tco_0169441 [Tanacetum coccineum]